MQDRSDTIDENFILEPAAQITPIEKLKSESHSSDSIDNKGKCLFLKLFFKCSIALIF